MPFLCFLDIRGLGLVNHRLVNNEIDAVFNFRILGRPGYGDVVFRNRAKGHCSNLSIRNRTWSAKITTYSVIMFFSFFFSFTSAASAHRSFFSLTRTNRMPLPPHPLSDILVVRQYPKSNAYIKRPPGTHNSYILRVVGWDNHIRLVCMQRSARKTTVEEQHIKSWGKSSFQSIFDRRRVTLTVAEFLHDFPKVSLQVSSIVCGNCVAEAAGSLASWTEWNYRRTHYPLIDLHLRVSIETMMTITILWRPTANTDSRIPLTAVRWNFHLHIKGYLLSLFGRSPLSRYY